MLFERIYNLCQLNQISIFDLENKVGFYHGAILRWKTNSPSYDKVIKVANYFGVSMDYLCGIEDISVKPSDFKDPTIISMQRFKKEKPNSSRKLDKIIENYMNIEFEEAKND